MDAKLTNDDLDLSTGDIVLLRGVDEALQRIKIKLRFFKGEWFLAPGYGVPWFRDVLIKNPQIDIIQNLLLKACETEPGVDKVTEFLLDYDATARTLSVSNLRIIVDGDFVDFENFQLMEL